MSEQGSNREFLLPCPFCGGRPDYHADMDNTWYVACTEKDCHVTPITPAYRIKYRARLAWNQRPQVSPEYYQPPKEVFTGLKSVEGGLNENPESP